MCDHVHGVHPLVCETLAIVGRPGLRYPAAAMRMPNFIVVLIDDLRFDEFGAGGHPYMETPHIDRLAREGAIFERAFHELDELYDLERDPWELKNLASSRSSAALRVRLQRDLKRLIAEASGL